MTLDFVKIFLPLTLSFLLGIALTPTITSYLYKWRLWKRNARKDESVNEDKMSEVFKAINNADELHTPRVGGIIVWLSVFGTSAIIWILSRIIPGAFLDKLDFVSRGQTYLLLFTLIVASLAGLFDDLLGIFMSKGKFANGFPRRYMIGIVTIFGLVGGSWFYFKLGISDVSVPFSGLLALGFAFIPFFTFVTLAVFSTGVIDGIDGLAGGVMAIIFAAFSTIAFFQNQIDIAVFCATVTGGIMAFLWFNIPPARFYMGETGMLGLTMTLTVVAFLTNQVFVLPLIALMPAVTSISSALQIISKNIRGPEKGKIFKVAPLHHHFEAIGWSRPKITMRYWILSVIAAVLGIILALIQKI